MAALAGLAVALLLTACGDGSASPTAAAEADADGQDLALRDDASGTAGDDDPTTSGPAVDGPAITPGEPNPSAPLSVEDLAGRFSELGADVVVVGEDEATFFLPAPQLLTVNGQEVRVFAYESVEELKADAARISADAGMLDGTPVRWMEAPYFFARGTFLVLYVGVDADVIDVLYATLGTPIAGRGAPTDVVSPPNPGVDDGDRLLDPALIVAGTEDEMLRLLALLQDERQAEILGQVDLSESWVVAVFRGQLPTAGYGVEIELVRVTETGGVVVEVSLQNPAKDALLAEVLTYPVDVAVVPRSEALDPAVADWVALTADGQPMARFADGVTSSGNDGVVPGTTVDPLPVDVGDGTGGDDDLQLPTADDLGVDVGDISDRFKVDIRGTISEMEVHEDADSAGVLMRILVEGESGSDLSYDRAWVDIRHDTALSFDGETFAPPTLRDLEPGRTVAVTFTGPVRESYPVQAVAQMLTILR
jgi:hypothetical protein